VKKLHDEWIAPGHRKGSNFHNVSVTVSIKDDEWESVGNWMWENRDFYNGISVLPFDGGTYVQAPFEECTEEEYNELYKKLHTIDLKYIYEEDDMTDLKGEVACGGGACEVK
jgi:ribonucleoside-diphosphate reductase alpha chain